MGGRSPGPFQSRGKPREERGAIVHSRRSRSPGLIFSPPAPARRSHGPCCLEGARGSGAVMDMAQQTVRSRETGPRGRDPLRPTSSHVKRHVRTTSRSHVTLLMIIGAGEAYLMVISIGCNAAQVPIPSAGDSLLAASVSWTSRFRKAGSTTSGSRSGPLEAETADSRPPASPRRRSRRASASTFTRTSDPRSSAHRR